MTFQNVIATHGPNDAPIIVVGAHYDAYGGLPGADDNASGVAGLLELNRLLALETSAGLTLDKQVILVAYTLEEPPIYASNGMGSVIHAESLRDKQVDLMISLEMIGYYDDETGSQFYPIGALGWIYPNTGHFITVVDELFSTAGAKLKKTLNQQGLIEAYSINAPTAIPGIDFSDHRSYWAHDMPAIMVTDTAFYRNQNYHTTGDTYDTLDYQRMSYVVSGVLAHIRSLAQN
jgi:Zn-dependent M28 family amino/carboxypeptidase